RRTIALVGSGPAVSARAAALTAAALGARQALSLDMGSTSTDIALVEDGAAIETAGGTFAGVPLRLPMADVESIALGGRCWVATTRAGGLVFSADGDSSLPTLDDALAALRLL